MNPLCGHKDFFSTSRLSEEVKNTMNSLLLQEPVLYPVVKAAAHEVYDFRWLTFFYYEISLWLEVVASVTVYYKREFSSLHPDPDFLVRRDYHRLQL